MADWPAKKNAAFVVTFPIYDADGDLVSAAAALDSEYSIDGGTFTDCTNEATEIATSSGVYRLSLVAAEMNGDVICTITKTSTSGAKTAVNVMYTATRQLLDLAYPAVTGRSLGVDANGRVDLGSWVGGTPNALQTGRVDAYDGAMAAGVITAAAIAADAIDDDAIATGAIGSTAFAAGAINAAALATGAITAAKFAAGAIDAAAVADGAIDAATFAAGAITAAAIATGAVDADAVAADAVAEIADGVWDEDIVAAHGTASTGGLLLRALGAAISTRANNPTLNALLGVTDSASRDVPLEVWAETTRTLSALGFALGTSDFTAGFLTAALIAADAIGASELAADAVNEIADGIFTRASSNWEASAPVKSLGTAVMKAVHRILDDAGTLKVYRSDGSTLHASQTITTDAGLAPIDELTGAA